MKDLVPFKNFNDQAPLKPPPSIAGFGLEDVFNSIMRRKWILLGVITGFLLFAAIALFLIPQRYTADVLLMVADRDSGLIDMNSVIPGLSGDAESISSEIEILKSRNLAKEVVGKLKLYRDEEFNDHLDLSAVRGQKLTEEDQSRVIDSFLKRLDVRHRSPARIISVAFSSEDPVKAALVANTLAERYIYEQVETKISATEKSNVWLKQLVATLRDDVNSAETAVERYRLNMGMIEGKEGDLATQQITELNSQLIIAKSARAEAQSRLRQSRRLINSPGGVESASEVLKSRLIQDLQAQEAKLQRKFGELSNEYGESHPTTVNFYAELSRLQDKIKMEVKKIIRNQENEVAIAIARQKSMQADLDKLKSQINEANQNQIQLRALESEAEVNKMLLDTVLSRHRETSSEADRKIQQADARVISEADVPVQASFPKTIPILALTVILATIIGLIAIFLMEHLDSSFRSSDQIERIAGVAPLGLVPLIADIKDGYPTPESCLLNRPNSPFTESIDTLGWTINLFKPANHPRKILITSAEPDEGKTTIATCLAIRQAVEGKKVLLIDADCRMPGIRKVLSLSNRPGIVDFINGTASLEDIILYNKESGLSVTQVGKSISNPSSVLEPDGFDRLLTYLTGHFDLIILDSPPVMAASDALILSSKVDTTVFVARWGETKPETVNFALKQIESSRGHVAGVLLTMVDMSKQALYGYAEYGSNSYNAKDHHPAPA